MPRPADGRIARCRRWRRDRRSGGSADPSPCGVVGLSPGAVLLLAGEACLAPTGCGSPYCPACYPPHEIDDLAWRVGRGMTRERAGTILCLVAALSYSMQPIFAKFAYAASVGVLTLLVVRYLVSATAFWTIVRVRGVPLPPRPVAIRAFLLGFCGTSVQVFLFATALTRLDAALGSLLLYSFPAMIAAGAIITRQERPSARRLIALAIASAGVVLVLGVAGGAGWDPLGVALALSSAFGAALYFLIGHRLLARVAPLPLATLGETGAGLAFLLAAVATRQIAFDFAPGGWWATIGLAIVSASALLASLSGMARVGPTTTGIVMMAETPLTVFLAFLLLSERLSPSQLAGGALVLAAVLLLNLGGKRREQAAPALGEAAPPASL